MWTVEQTAIVAAIIVVSAIIVAFVIGWALLRAGRHPAPSMLVLSVAILSMTALIGGLIFNSDSALAIASAGLGALAGAVSSTFTIQPRVRESDKKDKSES